MGAVWFLYSLFSYSFSIEVIIFLKSTLLKQISIAGKAYTGEYVIPESMSHSAPHTPGITITGEAHAGRAAYLDIQVSPDPTFSLSILLLNQHFSIQATTPLDPRVLDAMMPYYTDLYGNPHSRTHQYGWEAGNAVEHAREQVCFFLYDCLPVLVICDERVFEIEV